MLCLHSRGGTENNQEYLVRMALLRFIQPLHLRHDSYSGFTVSTPMKALFQSNTLRAPRGGGGERSGRDTDHVFPSAVDVKNE